MQALLADRKVSDEELAEMRKLLDAAETGSNEEA